MYRIDWNVEKLTPLLKQLIGRRKAGSETFPDMLRVDERMPGKSNYVAEVKESIVMPDLDEIFEDDEWSHIDLPSAVTNQLHSYVGAIAGMYRNNEFHNFEVRATFFRVVVMAILSKLTLTDIGVPFFHLS